MPTLQITDATPFTPNAGGQTQFMEDASHRFVALAGGLGAGKTKAGSRKLVDLHIFNAFDDANRPTFCRSAVVGDSYGNLFRYDVPAMEEAFSEAGLAFHVRRGDPPHILLPDLGTDEQKSLIFLCTAQRPERISGFEVGAFWCDEASRFPESKSGDPKTDPLIQIRGRLRGANTRFEQGIYTFTNEGDSTAVYKFFHQTEDMDDRAYYVASTRDNAAHVGEFLKDQLKNLSPDLVRQYVDGEAINLRGSFAYTCFSEDEHVVDEMKLDITRPLCMAIDFNINPGMHLYLGQYDRAGDVFRIRHEIHAPRLTIEGAIDRMRDVIASSGGFNHPGVLVYGDASGRGEWIGTSQSHYMLVAECLDRIGLRRRWKMKIPNANPKVANRVNAVQSALKDMAGGKHVQVHRSCGILINDLKQVKWDDKGKELEKKNPTLTHATDCLGYFIHRVRPLRFKAQGSGGGRFSVQARSIYS
jgi:hypothetical protein